MVYSYMRCSTNEEKQSFDRQIGIIKKENGIETDKDFCEYISGGKECNKRPAFNELLAVVKRGDIVYCSEMSRLSRSLQDLVNTVNVLVKEKGVTLIFFKERLTIGHDGLNAVNQLFFNMMGCIAEFEKQLISERVKDALREKQRNGTILGRPIKAQTEDGFDFIIKNYGKISAEDMCIALDVSKGTLYKMIHKLVAQGKIKKIRNRD